VADLYNKKKTADSDAEHDGDVLLDIDLYLKREDLTYSLGRFNGIVPVERMLVQTDLFIEGFRIDEIFGTVMVVHMDWYDRLTEGLLNAYFLGSVFHPMNLYLQIKSSKFHFRSSSYLFQNLDPGYVSYPKLHYNQLVKIADSACRMMCRVEASQPRTNWVHVDMLPYDLINKEEQTCNIPLQRCCGTYCQERGPCDPWKMNPIGDSGSPDQSPPRGWAHDRLYSRSHHSVSICFRYFFGIGARVCYPKSKSEQERVARKKAKTITTSLTAGVPDEQGPVMPITVPTPIPVLSPNTKIVTAPVTRDIMINTPSQLPEEATVNDKDVAAKYVHRGLEGITLLYYWASHRLTLRVT
jgi:hypothetical protein